MTESAERFVALQRTDNTRRAYRGDLAAWFTFIGDRPVTTEEAARFRDELELGSSNTAARRFTTVRAYHRFLVAQGLAGSDPFAFVKAPAKVRDDVPKTPGDDEVEALYRAPDPATEAGARSRAVIALLLNGLRASEVCDLGRDDFRYEQDYDRWIIRVTGKGNKRRLVPANIRTEDAVRWWTDRHGRGEWLVCTADGERMTRRMVYEIVRRYSDLHPHALRHHYATRLVRAGVNLLAVQRLMGHSRPDTTAVYVRLDLSDLVKATDIDPVDTRADLEVMAV